MGEDKVELEYNGFTDELVTVDVKITKWEGVELEKPLYMECNGPWVYPRNSKEPLGYGVTKDRKR